MTESISLRLPKDVLKGLDALAKAEDKDRSTIIREIINSGIEAKKLEQSIRLYRERKATAWRAASLAGVSLWRFIDVLRERGVLLNYSGEDLEEDLRGLRGGE